MGKGSRSRTNRANEVIAAASKPSKASSEKKTKRTIWIVTAIVAAFLAVCLIATFTVSSGFSKRMKTAVKSDNYRVSGTMLSYFFYSQYQQFMSVYGTYASYLGLDTGSSLKNQTYGDGTWYSYFMDNTKTQLKQVVALCEAAKAAGIELGEDEKKDIDDAFDAISKAALNYGYTANGYIQAMYGDGVNSSDLRKSLELTQLASKYLSVLQEELRGKVTEEDIEKYYKDNPASFLKADTLQYSFKADLKPAGAEATDEEKAAYETAKAEKKALAEELKKAATSADEYKKWIGGYLCTEEKVSEVFDSNYSTESSELAEADRPSDEVIAKAKADIYKYLKDLIDGKEDAVRPTFGDAKYADVLSTVVSSVYSNIYTSGYQGVVKDGVVYSDPSASSASDLDKWLFDSTRKDGDIEIVTTEGDTSSTYNVVFVTAVAHRDASLTKNAAHILISATSAGFDDDDTKQEKKASQKAKTMAEQILSDYEAGEKTLDSFKKIAEEKTEDGSVEYDNIYEGQMVTSFNDWVFDETRKAGDVGIVETEYGWHIIYFIGDGAEKWHADAEDGVLNEKLSDWYTEAETKYHITFDDKVLNSINA